MRKIISWAKENKIKLLLAIALTAWVVRVVIKNPSAESIISILSLVVFLFGYKYWFKNPLLVVFSSSALTACLFYGDWRGGGFLLFIASILLIGDYLEIEKLNL